MSLSALTLAAQRWKEGRIASLLLVVVLPILSYPLSWLPRLWAHLRFSCTWPIPEVVLALGLMGVGFLLQLGSGSESKKDGVSLAFPHPILLPLLAVVVSALASIRFSAHSYFGLGLLPRLGGNAAILLLAAHASRQRMREFRRWWVIVAVIVAGNGLLRMGWEPEFVSTFGNRNFLGAYLAASVIIGLSIGKAWSLLGSFVLVAAMWFCGSRGAWLTIGIVALLWFLCSGNGLLRWWQARAIIVLMILAGAGLLARSYVLHEWQTDVRPMIWKATLRMVAARPLLGHGLGTYVAEYPKYRLPEYFLRLKATNVTDHAHNELLEVAAEQGLIGLAATLWLWATAVSCGIRTCCQADSAERQLIVGLLGATVLLMLHGLVDIDLRYLPNQSLLWLLMGSLVGADATPSNWRRITIHSQSARLCTAVACVVLAVWIAVGAVIHPMIADMRDRRARLTEEHGDLAVAIQSSLDSLRIQPFRLSTQYFLAGLLSRLPTAEAHQMAIEQCLRIEEFAPDYADVTYNLGQLYLAAGRPGDALPHLRRAAEINPYDVQRHVLLATALHSLGRSEEAGRQLDYALQIQPGNQAARELLQEIRKQHSP